MGAPPWPVCEERTQCAYSEGLQHASAITAIEPDQALRLILPHPGLASLLARRTRSGRPSSARRPSRSASERCAHALYSAWNIASRRFTAPGQAACRARYGDAHCAI